MIRPIALVAVLGLGAVQAEAGERTRIYLDIDRGGVYGFGFDYRDDGYRHRDYRGGHTYRYRDVYRHAPPYGRAYGYWYGLPSRYDYAYRDGWRDGRRYERHRDRWHDRRRHCD